MEVTVDYKRSESTTYICDRCFFSTPINSLVVEFTKNNTTFHLIIPLSSVNFILAPKQDVKYPRS